MAAALKQQDPEANQVGSSWRNFTRSWLIEDAAKTNPEQTIRILGNSQDQTFLAEAIQNLSKSKPKLAWNLLEQYPVGISQRPTVETTIFANMLTLDAKEAIQMAPAILGEELLSHASSMATKLYQDGFESAWAAAEKLKPAEFSEALQERLRYLFAAALAWPEAMPRHLEERNAAIKSILQQGKDNIGWLLEHVHLLKKTDDIAEVLHSASQLTSSKAGRKTLVEWALSRGSKTERAAGLQEIHGRLCSVSKNEASELLALVKDASERSDFIAQLMKRNEDWDHWLPFIKTETGTGNGTMGAGTAAEHLAKQKSVAEALQWANSLPTAARKIAAYGGVWAAWSKQDASAAAAAALALPIEVKIAVCRN